MNELILFNRLAAGIFLVSIFCIPLSGCMTPVPVYSTHNLEDGGEHFFGGGGYRVTKLKPGTYEIKVITKRAKSMHPKTARKMWRDHAERVCGGGDYIEVDVLETEVRHEILFELDEYQNVREGKATCYGSPDPGFFEPLIVGQDTEASEFRELIEGNTITGSNSSGWNFDVYHAREGSIFGEAMSDSGFESEDTGTWTVTNRGEYCQYWRKWPSYCYRVYILEDEKFRIKARGRPYESTFLIHAGDSENLNPVIPAGE